jgi:SAM-dependent methyltransferase
MASDDLYELLKACIPNDHSRQVQPSYYVELLLRETSKGRRVLDLGCGTGKSADLFRRLDPQVEWHGVDIESSPEVASRTRTDVAFHSYDGVNLPFPEGHFSIVYSNQVFEHVRHPEPLLAEVARVLQKGGAFIGSVSYLEPYHSFSLWNFTPYGWYTLLVKAGMKAVEFRPGIDSIALIRRQYLGRPPEATQWFASSPMNEEIDAWGADTKQRPALVNLRKLQFCGHLAFYATKP